MSKKEDEKVVVGMHQGAHYYTIGQRKGLGIGGCVEPLSAVTPGQFAAWYIDNELIGSGVIS